MGSLRSIEIAKITAVKSDDLRVDDVYFHSYVSCGQPAAMGAAPDNPMPPSHGRLHRPRATVPCRQGVDMLPPAAWGRLFPVRKRAEHERCCDSPDRHLAGPVYFFDSDDPPLLLKIVGAIGVTFLAAMVALGVIVALSPIAMLLAVLVGVGAGAGLWALLARLWERLLRRVGRDDYLGGVTLSFPCAGTQTIETTLDLHPSADGIHAAARDGRTARVWSPSSAQYRVTFRALYD